MIVYQGVEDVSDRQDNYNYRGREYYFHVRFKLKFTYESCSIPTYQSSLARIRVYAIKSHKLSECFDHFVCSGSRKVRRKDRHPSTANNECVTSID